MASTYTGLYVHIIFATHNRKPVIQNEIKERLHGYLAGVIKGQGGTPVAVGGIVDHVHILCGLKATHAVADVVREVKKSSSIWMCQEGNSPGFSWQQGYGAFSVSPDHLERIKTYIESQEKHHATVSSADELKAILKELGVSWDERYFD